VAALAIYLWAFTIPYGLQSGAGKPLLQFARITGPSFGPTAALILSVGALFVLYLVAIGFCRSLDGSRKAQLVVLGLGSLCAMSLLWMYPLFSIDVFYYMATDRIWSVYHENPFVVPPLQASHDPFFPYTAWGHYPLPYGPLWPWIAAATSAPGRGDIGSTLLAFKTLGVCGYVISLPIVAWAVAGFCPERRVTGLCIFAWNPLVLLELAGGAHNDAIALIPAALALGLWARRRSMATALSLMLSFLVKATVSVAIPALLWPSFRNAMERRRLPVWLATHVVPAAGLFVLAWLPFWGGDNAISFIREGGQHYQSPTALVVAAMPPDWKGSIARAMQTLLVGSFILYYASQRHHLAEPGPPALRALWRIIVLYFLVVSPFFSPWYLAWPTLVAAMLAVRRVTVLTTLLCVGGLATYLVQFVVRPLAGPALSWMQFNALALLVATGPFLVGCAVLAWSQRTPVPTAAAVESREPII
jgi:alpha-1,6-mannosyltransferase